MVVLMSNDQEVDKMYGYMQEEDMPWPAMTLETLRASPVLLQHSGSGIPHLVILDRHGKVLATSHDGRRYLGVQPPFNTLKQLVSSGATR
jgi:nucleoredoxin